MKSKLLLLCLCLTVVSYNSFAKVWRVNNNVGVNANFTDIETAILSASVGNNDTLYVEGSATSYGNISNINKSVVIIGPGYFLSNWTTPVQFNQNPASLNQISQISANNVRIMGMQITNIFVYNANAFDISRCNISTIYLYGTSNNSSIRQNYLGQIISANYGPTTNIRIANNIFLYGFQFYSNDNGIMENNIFNLYNGQNLAMGNANFNFEKNIISGNSLNFTGTNSANITYNIAQSSVLPASGNNQNNIPMSGSSVFINNNYTLNNDQNFMLSAGSVAKTAGPGNTPIGAYAGATPYIASGIPPIPTIYQLSIPQSTITGSSVQVKFSSKSNN